MRKIETEMNSAIANDSNWSKANTMVAQCSDESKVYLHGNHIATIGEGFIQMFDGGWQSNTTKSRLNAILSENGLPNERVYQSNFKWYVQMQDGDSIPFFNGMRLN